MIPVVISQSSLGALGALFEPAYAIVLKNEGGYVNNPLDNGGPTYMGIARNIWPNWAGWRIIDEFHSNSGIETNTGGFLPLYEQKQILPLVEKFYRDLWSRSRAGQIANQEVANIYFDFYVLSSKAVEVMQVALNKLGNNVVVDNKIGPQTIGAINSTDPAKLHDTYKDLRIDFHNQMVQKGYVDASFMPGWKKRTAGFADMSPFSALNSIWGKTLLFTAGIGFILAAVHENQKRKLGANG